MTAVAMYVGKHVCVFELSKLYLIMIDFNEFGIQIKGLVNLTDKTYISVYTTYPDDMSFIADWRIKGVYRNIFV